MPHVHLPGCRLYYEERGAGTPILLIHGTGSDAGTWGAAVDELVRHGRVIAYDRRGFSRSRREKASAHTTVAEHAADAADLLDALDAGPTIVVGRSYGGNVALDLALGAPARVRALVLLEGGGEALSPDVQAFIRELASDIRTAVAAHGPPAASETLLRAVLGDDGYAALPAERKHAMAANGAAILAELEGFFDGQPDAERLRRVTCPVLVVAAEGSPPSFRSVSEDLARALPDARLVIVPGGHLITPAEPQVVAYIREVLGTNEAPRNTRSVGP